MENKVVQFKDYKTIPPEHMDSFNNGTIMKAKETNSNHKNYSDGDGSDMDKYATKEELKTLETKIDGRFNVIDKTLENLPDKMKLLINESDEKRRADEKDTKRFFWGTIIIGGISAISAIISVILTIIFH